MLIVIKISTFRTNCIIKFIIAFSDIKQYLHFSPQLALAHVK